MAIVVAACSLSAPGDALANRLRRLAAPRVGPEASVLGIDAETEEQAWARVVRARTEAPLEESQLLARLFEASATAPVEVVTGGPYSQLTDQVLRDAFALTPRGPLPHLHLVCVGPEGISEALVTVCVERQARCEHAAWRSTVFD